MGNRVRFLGMMAAGLLLAGTGMAATEVYRWVDADGVVHFGDRPPEGVDARPVSVRPNAVPSVAAKPAGPQAPGGEAPAGGQAPAGDAAAAGEAPELTFAQQRRKERTERRAERAEEARKLDMQCAAMRKQKEWVEPNPRVLVQDEDGSTRRLEDSERERLLKEASDFLAANCN